MVFAGQLMNGMEISQAHQDCTKSEKKKRKASTPIAIHATHLSLTYEEA
jgi:hypothetical protein